VGPAVKAVRVPSFAKVNLGLEVLGLRADGTHELRTLFQAIDLRDEIELRPSVRTGEVTVACDHPDVPLDEGNLALRAVLELRRYAGLSHGVALHIHKRIPVAGGLGGGSSNAAAVLLALDRAWHLKLGPTGLLPLARRLGADVPFFLTGGTALGIGRGDEVYPLWRQLRGHLVLVDPGQPVSTAAVFRRLDQSLTPRENSNTIYRFVSRDLEGQAAYRLLTNDLEQAALQEVPDLAVKLTQVRDVLVRRGARLAALSGSGSTYFGLFDSAAGARVAQTALKDSGFDAVGARTVSLEHYRRAFQLPGASAGRNG